MIWTWSALRTTGVIDSEMERSKRQHGMPSVSVSAKLSRSLAKTRSSAWSAKLKTLNRVAKSVS